MDLHDTWSHRWIHPHAESRESKLHGLGVFAKKKILKGEIVALLGGIIVPTKEIEKYWKEIGHVGIQIHDDFFIVPTSRDELIEKGVYNHSCDPNIGFLQDIVYVAIKDIEAGEELCFDYAFNETKMESFTCECKSKNCRKTITKEDWKRKDIQEKYGEFYSPYLKRKLAN